MTFEEFRAECLDAYARYNRDELNRMKKAMKLHQRYEDAMRKLGLHPLSKREIYDRQREMEAREPQSEEMLKAIYEIRFGNN